MSDRRKRLAAARLYLVCEARDDGFLRGALRGGVDIVQLRSKAASDAALVSAGRRFARLCAEVGALLIINDRPHLVDRIGADGVHLGQDDASPAEARARIGPECLIGLSTHTPQQIDAAGAGVDYIGVGPVHATPTKPGREAVGVDLVSYAAAHASLPFFAIGGINAGNIEAVRGAGARRVAVVRALTETEDPQAAAQELRGALTGGVESGVRVGAT